MLPSINGMVHNCWSVEADMNMMHGSYNAKIAGQRSNVNVRGLVL